MMSSRVQWRPLAPISVKDSWRRDSRAARDVQGVLEGEEPRGKN